MELTAVELSAACLVVASSALLQGSIGFGFSVLAAPLLVLINPLFVPGPLRRINAAIPAKSRQYSPKTIS